MLNLRSGYTTLQIHVLKYILFSMYVTYMYLCMYFFQNVLVAYELLTLEQTKTLMVRFERVCHQSTMFHIILTNKKKKGSLKELLQIKQNESQQQMCKDI